MISVSRWRIRAGASRKSWIELAAIAFVIFTSLCIAVPIAQAQNAGTIVGSVYDTTGAVVPNATVKLINQASQDERGTVSNGEGFFTFGTVLRVSTRLRSRRRVSKPSLDPALNYERPTSDKSLPHWNWDKRLRQ